MPRKKPSTGIPAAAFMSQGFNGGTRDVPKPPALPPMPQFTVCDKAMRVLSQWPTLTEAKQEAERLAADGAVHFACGHNGAIWAGFGGNKIPQPPTGQSAEQQTGRGAVEPELPAVGSAPATPSREADAPFTCPECGSHEAYLLRDTLLRVTRYEPGIKLVEVATEGELTLDVECKNCRCVVELGEDWTVGERSKGGAS